MRAYVTRLSVLFERVRQLEVPFFQRPYVWRKENWKPFWEDVAKTVNNLDTDDASPHFFGAVILDQEESSPTIEIDRRQIIDGQQRLITTQLLFTAARDIADRENWQDYFAHLEQLTLNNPARFSNEDIPKIRPINPDNGDFAKIILGDAEQTNSEALISSCHEYFFKTLDDWLGKEDRRHQFQQLLAVLSSYLNIVLIDIEQGDDAQAIFETLNNRGLSLAKSDLIWNFLVRESRDPQNQPNNLQNENDATQYLFQEMYWREEESVGRLNLPKIDIFMMHFLAMKQLDFVTHKNIFKEFKKWYHEARQTCSFQEVLDEILKYGKISRTWRDASSEDSEGRLFANLNLLGAASVHPLFLWLFGLDDQALEKEKLSEIIDIIESYLFRRSICGYTSAGYNRHFIRVLSELQTKDDLHKGLIEILTQFETTTTKWPTNHDVINELTTFPFGRRVRKDRCRYILSRINQQIMDNEKDHEILNYKCMTVEHLMPRRWHSADWPIEDESEYSQEIRNSTIELIGNLSLLAKRLNIIISNGPWPRKRCKILKHSAFAMSRTIPETWDEEAIHKRTQRMAKIICQIWPRPDLDTHDSITNSDNNT